MGKVSYKQINTFFSTLNFILCFIGYEFSTVIFLSNNEAASDITQAITIPYRFFALLISLMVIILNVRRKISIKSIAYLVFIFFWLLFSVRIFYDLFLRPDVFISDKYRLLMYVFAICFVAVVSVSVSYQSINFKKTFWCILTLSALMLIRIFIFRIDDFFSHENVRQSANVALSTISFGHLCTLSAVLSIFAFVKLTKGKYFLQIILLLLFLFSIILMFKSGSRSPILALFVIIFFWVFAEKRNFIIGFFVLLFISIVFIIFLDDIIAFIGYFAPITEIRLRAAIYEGHTSGRDILYDTAFNVFLKNPFIGDQFAIFGLNGSWIYSHNIILDALMGLGIIGGILIIYILIMGVLYILKLIKSKNYYLTWVGLLLIQQITLVMFSGAFYQNQLLNVLLAYILITRGREKIT